MQKLGQNARMSICTMNENVQKRGTLDTNMCEYGDEKPRVAISGATLFSVANIGVRLMSHFCHKSFQFHGRI